MKPAVIGVGQAGGKITDALLAYDDRADTGVVRAAVAVDTARAGLLGLQHVPLERRVLIGRDRANGHGVGTDNAVVFDNDAWRLSGESLKGGYDRLNEELEPLF